MLADVKRQSAARLIEVRESLDHLRSIALPPPSPEPSNVLIAKGLFFVHLYAAYEFTLKSAVVKSIEIINSRTHSLNSCKPHFFSLALNSNLDAIANVGEKKWEKRFNLFNNFIQNPEVSISQELFPTNGRNINCTQLQSIWNSFSISSSILPRNALIGRVNELVGYRNAIAHGNNSASEIGSRNSISDLYLRYTEISEVCSYVLDTIEEHIVNEKYLIGN